MPNTDFSVNLPQNSENTPKVIYMFRAKQDHFLMNSLSFLFYKECIKYEIPIGQQLSLPHQITL